MPTIALAAGSVCGGSVGSSALHNSDFACGKDDTASGIDSSAFGNGNTAAGNESSAFGYGNTANGSFGNAFGYSNHGSGTYSNAFGYSNFASGDYSNAFGHSNGASGDFSAAFGLWNGASGDDSNAFGQNNQASGLSSSAFGSSNLATGEGSTAFGARNFANAKYSSAFGFYSSAKGLHSLAIGGWFDRNGNSNFDPFETTLADGAESVAVGLGVRASGTHASAFGVGSTASGDSSLALGLEAQATASDSVALGSGALADEANTLSVGAAGRERRIVHVAAGTADNDAVIVSQLSPFASTLGGGAGFTGGVFTAPAYVIQGTSYGNIGSAFGAVDASLADLYAKFAGTPDQVSFDDASHRNVSLDTGGTIIGNVAAGKSGSDAVNVSQLNSQTSAALSSARTYTDASSMQTLNSARAYTDQQIANALDAGLGQFEQQTNARFNQQDKRIDNLGAMGAASSQMAINTAGLAGDNRIGFGAGTYNGQQAASVGYQHMFADHKASVSIGASFGGGDTSGGVGAGFSW